MERCRAVVFAGIVLVVAAAIGSAASVSIRRNGSSATPMMMVGCTSVPSGRARNGTGTEWHDVRAQPELQFAFVWNAQFRSHEIVWRNRGLRALHVRFAADSVGTTAARTYGRKRIRERVLEAGFTETMPGESIAPARQTGVVCVHLEASNQSTD